MSLSKYVLMAVGAGAAMGFIVAVSKLGILEFLKGSRKALPKSIVKKWRLSDSCEIDSRIIYSIIEQLERLLCELEVQKFSSEICRGKCDLLASILSRLRSLDPDFEKYMNDDFSVCYNTEDIARSLWSKRSNTRTGTLSVLSDNSFYSAQDEFPTLLPSHENSISIDLKNLDLYNAGLMAFESGSIFYRKSRTEICGCDSEQDFAAKLYSIRLAFDKIMENQHTVQRLIQLGRIIIAGLLRHHKHDPTKFYTVYDRMMAFISNDSNSEKMLEELNSRRVYGKNFWDVLIDLIMLDAFEDLQKPPTGIMALANNPYMSRSMKESTINNLVWSLIKLKRGRLQIKDGFISHFYDISQILTCPLTMGLLGGSSKEFQDICLYFKDTIFTFVQDIFNLNKVRFTTVDELSDDIEKVLIDKLENMEVMLNSVLPPV